MKHITTLFVLVTALLMGQFAYATNVQAEKAVLTANNLIFQELEKRKAELATNPSVLNDIVEKHVLPLIDFDAMAKLTLGKYWKTATSQQQTRFLTAYQKMLINSYAKNMVDYAGAVMTVKGSVSADRAGYETVRTIITPKGRAGVDANYDVRDKSGTWKAYNIEILGLNLITNFRTNFTREISSKGLEALITRLEKENAE